MRFILFVLLVTSSLCFAQKPLYNIQFKVNGWKDTTAYLGHYYGESTYLRDTAKVNSKGEIVFDGKKPLERGVYFLVLNKAKIFEFVVGTNKSFRIDTDATDYIANMKVTGDADNELFFDNWRFSAAKQKEAEPMMKILRDSTLSEDAKKDAREKMNKVREQVMDYQRAIIKRHPETISAILFNSTQEVAIPDPPKRADGKTDSTFRLRYYRQHFFDNINLADDAMIRMPQPIYSEKINEYLDKLFVPNPDSLNKAIDFIVGKAKSNSETYKYAVFTLMRKFQEPEIMGLDAVYVSLYDKYVATGEMDFWMNASHKKNVKEYADRLRKSLIGKTGPNMIMLDDKLQARSLHGLKNKYTILYIYDPDCGHCKKETPKLVSFYEKNKAKFDIEVFAVCTDSSMVKMKKYIKEMNMKWVNVNGPRTSTGVYSDSYDAITTPSLFILDDRKKIIGKKIPAENLENFFINYEKYHKVKNPAKPDGEKLNKKL